MKAGDDNSLQPSIDDNSLQPSIENCLKYWYGEMHDQAELTPKLTGLCQVGLKPPLQCMFDRLEFCKGRMLIELTDSLSAFITDIERKLLWHAAFFGQELVCKESEKIENRTVKAVFLQWLLTNPKAVHLISTYGVRAEGITIEGDLNLDSITIPFPLILKGCFFKGDIILTDAETCHLSLEGSTCNFIKAERIRVKGSFRLDNSFKAKQGVNIYGADISGDLDCKKGRFINKGNKAFSAKHIQVGGNLILINSYVNGEANLSGANIRGNLDCSGGEFINSETDNSSTQNEIHALDTSLTKVDGKVCFKSFRVSGHVFALEMKVGGDFDCTGSRIEHTTGNYHAISIDRSSIGGDLLLCQGFSATGQVRLIGTIIAGNLDCSGGTFDFFNEKDTNALYAPRAKVDGSVLLCGSMKELNNQLAFETKGWINLEFTNINHSIKVGYDKGNKTSIFKEYTNTDNKKLGGGIKLEGAKITNSLEWDGVGSIRGGVELSTETILDLRGATVGNLVTRMGERSWPNLYLNGFVYDRIEHQGLYNNYETHLNWLKKQRFFNPQIYEQLATVLRRNGQDADAIEISIEKEKIKRKPERPYWKNLNWLWYLWSLTLNITIGYGYRAYKALFFSLIVIVLGGLIFDKGYDSGIMVPVDKEAFEVFTKYYAEHHQVPPSDFKPLAYYTAFEPFVYSFDVFFPIGNLHQQEKWQPEDHKEILTLRHYLYFIHIPFGWLLITLGIAGFAGFIRKN